MKNNSIRLAQISDSHLYSDIHSTHHGAKVYENLCRVLENIKMLDNIDYIIFTGDLTQDHSSQSYQNFVDAFRQNDIEIPTYFLAGNHDEHRELAGYLSSPPFKSEKVIRFKQWDIVLLNSKSATPSGVFELHDNQEILSQTCSEKYQLFFMHHHPVDAGYFIDNHGLENKPDFYHMLDQYPQAKAVGCGHVHNAMTLPLDTGNKTLPLYTCPATSIQFDKTKSTVANSGKPAGYRVFELYEDGAMNHQVIFLNE